jgi:hypothetical protein
MKHIIMLVSLLMFAFPSYGKDDLQQRIRSEIDALLITGDYSYKILSVSEVTDNLIAVSLTPPYREFPNIILFKAGQGGSSLKRIYEAFSLGIQDEKSKLLDLHTVGNGIDFTFEKEDLASLTDTAVKTAIATFEKEGGAVVWYGNFFHGHFGQRTKQRYFIDKSRYKIFAIELLGKRYNEYPAQECMMYDTPDLVDVKFFKRNDVYHIEGKTSNKQKWTVTFKGTDEQNKYFVQKAISVGKMQR